MEFKRSIILFLFLASIVIFYFEMKYSIATNQVQIFMNQNFRYVNVRNTTFDVSTLPFDTSTSESILDTEVSKLKLNPKTEAYEFEGKPIIWHYWDKVNVPLYTRLLIEALQCRNPEFHTITVHESTIYQYLPDLDVSPDVWDLLYAAHQADIFRLAILLRYGGVYTDIDVYPLDKLYPLYELLKDYHLVIGDWGSTGLAFGGMGPSRANISLFRVWHSDQVKKIKEKLPNGNQKNLTDDPFGWTEILYGVEWGIYKEIEAGRVSWIHYKGPETNNQLIDKGLQHMAHGLWANESSKFLPLNWSPFLFVWGGKMKEMFSGMTSVKELLPQPPNIYSAFAGCGLLDCYDQYIELLKSDVKETPVGHLNLTEVVEVLENMNRTICEQIRKEPIFELEKYRIRP